MNRGSVNEYVEKADSILSASPQMDEANTKAAVLRDFLTLLDWEIPTNTQLEYSVKAFGQTYKVDYALVLDGTPVAFVEAKGADTSLTPKHEDQLSSYMTNKNVSYGILTNGKQYRFFQRLVDASEVNVQRVADVELNNLPDRLRILRAYTKSAIESDEAKEILGQINELRAARRTLEEQKDDLATALADMLTDRVSDTISSLAESQLKEMIDRLVEDIESEIDSDGPGPDPPPGGRRNVGPGKNNIVGRIKRSNIEGRDDAKVAVFPTKESGVDFLRENNAWGFVRIGQVPDFVAMYVSEDAKEVKYIASVRDVVSAPQAELARSHDAYFESASDEAQAGFDPDQSVVVFEEGSLYELADPIPFETKYPQSLQYTTLGALRTADTTDDML